MAQLISTTLLSNAATDGAWVGWNYGDGVLTVEGTIGGATTALQIKGPNGTAIDVGPAATFTVLPAAVGVSLRGSCEIRMRVTGGAPSGLYARITADGAPE